MTNCEIKKEENPQLGGVKCCEICHNAEVKRTETFVCCAVFHAENVYRPSARAVDPTKS